MNKTIVSIRLVFDAYDVNLVATCAKFISVTRQSNMKPPIRPKLEIVQNKIVYSLFISCLQIKYFLFIIKFETLRLVFGLRITKNLEHQALKR